MDEDIKLKSPYFQYSDSGEPKSVFDLGIFADIKANNPMFVFGGKVYFYVGGVYIPDYSGARLKTKIRQCLEECPKFVNSRTIDRIFKLFLQDYELEKSYEELNAHPREWVNFRSGMFDPVSRELIPHSPEFLSINQIPHVFYPDAPVPRDVMPELMNFLETAFDCSDDLETFLEFGGLTMTTDTRFQKFLILQGRAGSGKSTLISLLEAAVGSQNAANVSLLGLTQRFGSYGLIGKLLNSCADLETTALEDVSVMKKAVGEDYLTGEAKGRDAISFKNYAKFLFSTNELPTVQHERSNGFYRRLIILEMNNQPKHRDTQLLETLTRQMPLLLDLCMDALHKLYTVGSITESDSSKRAVERMRESGDSVQAFLNAEFSGGDVERGDFYQEFDAYCTREGRQPLSKPNFYKALRTKGFSEVTIQGRRYFRDEGAKVGAKLGAKDDFKDVAGENPFEETDATV